ncbi:hypothetical protein EMIT0194MI4_40299 [Pseudomonas sp. IT-194MI4]
MDPVGARLAREGGLMAGRVFDGVHIRFCGNGYLWFRPYGDSLFYKRLKKEAKNARPKRPAPR